MSAEQRASADRGLGLRGRVTLSFAAGAALVSLVLALSVFTISRGYLLAQRERSAVLFAEADADFIARSLTIAGVGPDQALEALDPSADTVLLLRWRGTWASSDPVVPAQDPSPLLTEALADGGTATESTTLDGIPYLISGVPIDDGVLYEFTPVVELQNTIQVLRVVLLTCGLAATIGGATLGLWASRRVLRPLRPLATTAARIAGGKLDSRLPEEADADLRPILSSFNTMVDSLQHRIERERRFVGDVTHELRTPLTTLVTSVEVLGKHAGEMSERSRTALRLVDTELVHLRGMVEDLLALARAEAGLHHDDVGPVEVRELLEHVVGDRAADLLHADGSGLIRGHKLALVRAFTNLVENADRHGLGVSAITLRTVDDTIVVDIDDDGPGVAESERDRIFERFATGRAARGSTTSNGLGLALVAETIAAHGGSVACVSGPRGGARFHVVLPRADDDEQDR
ncbi:sensor histidine kinase [Actinokineospora pegani]|uniref:sensor histidine kinase n=1 Tax=Actinokineospora pegani TaxID=2654637 RepID=UPI0012EAFA61|nr:HAMP domain-containing sensor histidine kinase [Actinokineospora pegani]